MTDYINSFKSETQLIRDYGEGNAFLIWVMGLYLDYSDLNDLADECLTDQGDDKKIDFLRIDDDRQKIYVVQGYYSGKLRDNAPANKASDLNTAAAWLTTGNIAKLPVRLQEVVKEARKHIVEGETKSLELVYVHNCSESVPVEQELKTAKEYFQKAIGDTISITYKEIGNQTVSKLYKEQNSNIKVLDILSCPFKPGFEEKNGTWNSVILTVTGDWLRSVYQLYNEDLFSANYRGFLGLTRKAINTGIKNTADKNPENFWAYNNGITILTNKLEVKKNEVVLHGISIINGAQTTGSIGSLDLKIDLRGVQILTRIIECGDPEVVSNIVKYNNTQNKITSWDKFGNDSHQQELEKEFASYHHVYSSKRGFENRNSQLSIENCIQPLLSFLGYYKESNKSKVALFSSQKIYKEAFEHAKARHVLFVSCLDKCVVEIRREKRNIVRNGGGNVTEQDRKINDIFVSLNSKQFVIAILGELLTKLFVDLNDKSQIAFTPEFANAERYKINALVVEMKPFVESAIGLIASYQSDGRQLMDLYKDENIVSRVAEQATQMLNMFYSYSPSHTELKNQFKRMICNG